MLKEKWVVNAKKADFDAWASELNISPITARILRNRGVMSVEAADRFLNGSLKDIYDAHELRDADAACDEIIRQISDNRKIRIIGDYDVDGVCSTYILYKAFMCLGACVDYIIPHRIFDGYGLNDRLIEEAKTDGVNLIVTCDNGIAATDQLMLARKLGIDVIVTDHHEVPYEEKDGVKTDKEIPALFVVDPKQKACNYPFEGICGAVVAYKLVELIYEKTKNANLAQCFDGFTQAAAMATVCDVMDLVDENRIIVKEGLKLFRTSPIIGIKALISVSGLKQTEISSYHIGFVLGPCLNASGRLDTAKRAIELLLSENMDEAYVIASELKALNESRKNMTSDGVCEAIRYVEANSLQNRNVLVIYLSGIHESLAGIIAGKVKEKYNRPTIIFTDGEECVKGSARSIEAYNIFEHLTECKDLLLKYGGHKLAAGLSIQKENIGKLEEQLNQKANLKESDFEVKVTIDVPMPISYATLQLAEEINVLEPFGNGNPKPLFAEKDISLLECRKIGKDGKYARLKVKTGAGAVINAMYFGNPDELGAYIDSKEGEGTYEMLLSGRTECKLSVTYQLGINEFMGKKEAQIEIKNYC